MKWKIYFFFVSPHKGSILIFTIILPYRALFIQNCNELLSKSPNLQHPDEERQFLSKYWIIKYIRFLLPSHQPSLFLSLTCNHVKISVNPRIEFLAHSTSFSAFLLDYGKHFSCKDLRTRKPNTRNTKTLEPVSSTSRRVARAAYHDEYPRDFGPRIAYTVS